MENTEDKEDKLNECGEFREIEYNPNSEEDELEEIEQEEVELKEQIKSLNKREKKLKKELNRVKRVNYYTELKNPLANECLEYSMLTLAMTAGLLVTKSVMIDSHDINKINDVIRLLNKVAIPLGMATTALFLVMFLGFHIYESINNIPHRPVFNFDSLKEEDEEDNENKGNWDY